jgi:beta-lactam-binding protein with PASTA domain
MIEQTAVSDETAATIEARPAGPPPGPPVEPPPDRDLWPWLLVLLVLVLGGLAVAYLASRDDNGSQPAPTTQTVARAAPRAATHQRPAVTARVAVPRLVGLTAPAAVKRLQQLGLTATTHNVFSHKPRSQVVAQSPMASRELANGAEVALTVSKGPKAAPVADVVGQTVADAISTLRAEGFRSRIARVPSSEPAGQVVAQHPKAGANAPSTVVVRLNLSDGKGSKTHAPTTSAETAPRPITTRAAPAAPSPSASANGLVQVPDLEGKKLIEARQLLRWVGLVIEIRRVPNAQSLGTVVAQAKKPSMRLKRGSHLLVTVSTGPAQSNSFSASESSNAGEGLIAVPDVTGQDETTATQELQSAGLTVRVVDRDTPEASEDGIVVEQAPAANESVQTDSTVTIYVGRYAGPAIG